MSRPELADAVIAYRLPGVSAIGVRPRLTPITLASLNAAGIGGQVTYDARLSGTSSKVTGLRCNASGLFEVQTVHGGLNAEQVVVATGPCHTPAVPRVAERLPDTVVQLHSSQYRRPTQLPAGAVLVVGTGRSGCQIAEDLHLAGRQMDADHSLLGHRVIG